MVQPEIVHIRSFVDRREHPSDINDPVDRVRAVVSDVDVDPTASHRYKLGLTAPAASNQRFGPRNNGD